MADSSKPPLAQLIERQAWLNVMLWVCGVVIVAILVYWFAARPLIRNTIDRHVEQQVTQRLNTDTICRERDTVMCRELIDRVVAAATIDQEHSLAVRLFRSLTAREIRQLGLQGPRGRRGAPGPRGATGRPGRSLRGRTGRSGRTGQPGQTVRGPQGPGGAPGQSGPPGPSGPTAPSGGGGGAGGTPTPGGSPAPSGNPPGPEGNKNDPVPCPPKNPHC